MEMLGIATKYFESGLSVVALDDMKMPLGKWKERQNILMPPSPIEKFKNCYGIGIIAGAVSGNLECIDVDCKYDLTGTLMEDFTEAIAVRCDVLNKVVIEKTKNGGWHILYRCKEIGRNQKLANRYATDDEKKKNPNEAVKSILETRGEGGYFMCAPSEGYEVTYGDLTFIPEISIDERRIMIECAKAFNKVYKPEVRREHRYGDVNPFSEYDSEADTVSLLQEYGWKVAGKCDGNIMLKRPGDTDSRWSAGYHPEKKLFNVFSTSTIFTTEHAHSPSGVLCQLKFNGDWRECAKWLYDRNYGKQERNKVEDKLPSELFSTILSETEYLKQARDGTISMGLSTGFPELDTYWRLKESYLVAINGVDNVGKSLVMWYLYLIAAINHGWNFLIYSGENPKSGKVFKKLIEFYIGKTITSMSDDEYKKAKEFVDSHFTLIKNRHIFTYKDILDIGDKALSGKKYNLYLIDPYNSLYRDKRKGMNPHDYDYEALGDIRQWISDTGTSIHIICHSATEALRKYYPKDHPTYANLVMPPNKADTEGGGKFANRTDDFLTIHRHAQSENHWMWTEIFNRKNRDNDTGGRQTPYDKPFKMKLNRDATAFEDERGYNPILKNEPPKKEEIKIDENVYGKPIEEYPF